jgi:hypothetical protein
MEVAVQEPLEEYFSALERLKAGRPKIVRKGTRITNDAVSIEAGRSKGSIKKSRDAFAGLISSIALAATEQSNPKNQQKERLAKARALAAQYQCDLEAALAREVSLLKELYDVRKELARLRGDNIVPIRRQ